jgi:hypothetical protein
MLDVGGTAHLLPQAFPTLQFNFTPWSCVCSLPFCGLCVLCEARHPLYAIDNDGFDGQHGYSDNDGCELPWELIRGPHIQLMLDYRAYMLSISPSSSPKAPQFVLISRNEEPSNSLFSANGGEERNMSPEAEVQLRQAVSTSGLLPGNQELQLIFTENKTLTDQVAMFRGVRLFIAQHGAGMTHCLWMPAGSTVIEIITPSWAGHWNFKWICSDVNGLTYHRFVTDTNSSSQIDTARFLKELGETVLGLWS